MSPCTIKENRKRENSGGTSDGLHVEIHLSPVAVVLIKREPVKVENICLNITLAQCIRRFLFSEWIEDVNQVRLSRILCSYEHE